MKLVYKETMRMRYPTVPLSEFERFVTIVRKLRKECPWDREQTHQSISESLIEETYEVIEALDENNLSELQKELGDLLLHVAMQATIAEESGEFKFRDILRGISHKLIRRHPHVFGSKKVADAIEVKHNWEKLKMDEGRSSILEGIPKGLPALQRARRVQERAAKAGFDWSTADQVWEKVHEESEEVRKAVEGRSSEKLEEEFGDYLFALVNYARFVNVNPETALRKTIGKFTRRFEFIEQSLRDKGKDIYASSLEEMDALWNKAKERERQER